MRGDRKYQEGHRSTICEDDKIQGSCTSRKSGKTGKPYQIQGFSGTFREVFVLKVMDQGKSGKKFSQ